jgi:hypothetical protein
VVLRRCLPPPSGRGTSVKHLLATSLHACFCVDLMTDATFYSETPANSQRSTLARVPEDMFCCRGPKGETSLSLNLGPLQTVIRPPCLSDSSQGRRTRSRRGGCSFCRPTLRFAQPPIQWMRGGGGLSKFSSPLTAMQRVDLYLHAPVRPYGLSLMVACCLFQTRNDTMRAFSEISDLVSKLIIPVRQVRSTVPCI